MNSELLQSEAEQIIKELQRKTAKLLPALSEFLSRFPFTPVGKEFEFETDGTQIFYSPYVVVKMKRHGGMPQLWYRYMHIFAHGFLGHFVMSEERPKDSLFHALMDIEVSEFLEKLGVKDPAKMPGRAQSVRWQQNKKEEEKEGLFVRYSKAKGDPDEKKRIYAKARTCRQDHYEYWHKKKGGISNRELFTVCEGEVGEELCTRFGLRKGRRGQYGSESADWEMSVTAKEEACLDYRKELKRFFRMRESKKEEADSIDKALYVLGLQMYEHALLLEPEEMAEKKGIHTVIIAIDTSGSCMYDLLEQFLAETREILSVLSEQEFCRIIVLECDAGIKKETVYKDAAELPGAEKFRQGMRMHGFGGTSFVPVFEYADALVNKTEKVDCLICLTDGFGTFPEKEEHGYETFFVLSGAEDFFDSAPKVPQWIRQVYIKEETQYES